MSTTRVAESLNKMNQRKSAPTIGQEGDTEQLELETQFIKALDLLSQNHIRIPDSVSDCLSRLAEKRKIDTSKKNILIISTYSDYAETLEQRLRKINNLGHEYCYHHIYPGSFYPKKEDESRNEWFKNFRLDLKGVVAVCIPFYLHCRTSVEHETGVLLDRLIPLNTDQVPILLFENSNKYGENHSYSGYDKHWHGAITHLFYHSGCLNDKQEKIIQNLLSDSASKMQRQDAQHDAGVELVEGLTEVQEVSVATTEGKRPCQP